MQEEAQGAYFLGPRKMMLRSHNGRTNRGISRACQE